MDRNAAVRSATHSADRFVRCCFLAQSGSGAGLASGEQQGAAVRGYETSRRMNAGLRVARVERGSAYAPPSDSRCFQSVIARNDRRTMRRCARLATPGAGSRASRDPVCCSRGHERPAPAPTGPTIDRFGSGNPGRDMFG